MHIGVFILLLLSGERNFGVRLNKPYTATVPMDIPVFTGNYINFFSAIFLSFFRHLKSNSKRVFICSSARESQDLNFILAVRLVGCYKFLSIIIFEGTHADLLVTVFHKIITTGHQRLQPLFDCLLTILVNVSPYLKTLSMVASTKLLHLLEAFSTPWFLFSAPTNHHLVFFLLEIFNNIIQVSHRRI